MKRAFCFLLTLGLLLSVTAACFADTAPVPKPTAKPGAAPEDPAPSPYPAENGEIILAPDYEGACEIKVIADGDTDFYIYLEYLGESEKSATDKRKSAWKLIYRWHSWTGLSVALTFT